MAFYCRAAALGPPAPAALSDNDSCNCRVCTDRLITHRVAPREISSKFQYSNKVKMISWEMVSIVEMGGRRSKLFMESVHETRIRDHHSHSNYMQSSYWNARRFTSNYKNPETGEAAQIVQLIGGSALFREGSRTPSFFKVRRSRFASCRYCGRKTKIVLAEVVESIQWSIKQ